MYRADRQTDRGDRQIGKLLYVISGRLQIMKQCHVTLKRKENTPFMGYCDFQHNIMETRRKASIISYQLKPKNEVKRVKGK